MKRYLIPILVVAAVSILYVGTRDNAGNMTADKAIARVKSAYPAFKDYPSDNLPPKRVEVVEVKDGWRIGMYMMGSGLPGILKADCFLVTKAGTVTDTGMFQGEGPATGIDLATCTPIIPENEAGEADPSRMTLHMNTWKWISTSYNDGRKIVPKKSGAFSLTFSGDSFSAQTDCNSLTGGYTVKGNMITVGSIAMTKMHCEGSQDQEFARMMEGVAEYHFTQRGELIFGLKFDSGTMTFR